MRDMDLMLLNELTEIIPEPEVSENDTRQVEETDKKTRRKSK